MKKHFVLLLLSAVCCCFGAGKPLVSNGQSRGAIVIPAQPNAVERFAAQELQSYLEKITGVKLPVVDTEAKVNSGYRLGRAAGIRFAPNTPPDEWRSQLKDGFLEIAGTDGDGEETDPRNPAGTLFGVYEYLHKDLGVRWLWPGEGGEFVPQKKELVLAPMVSSRSSRFFRYTGPNGNLSRAPELYRWYRRNMNYRMANNTLHAGRQGHAFEEWPDRYGKKHPEWFSLKNGKRQLGYRATLCVSNPELQQEIVRRWYELQQKSDKQLLVNIKENDNQMRCECDVCRSWDGPDDRGPTGRYQRYKNVSERYCRFAVEVLARAQKLRPDACVSFFAYHGNVYAPRKVKLNKNCLVSMVPDLPFPRIPEHTKFLRREYDLWAASGATLHLRPNYFGGGYVMPEVWYDEFADELKYLCKLGIIAYHHDFAGANFASNGINYYVMARLANEPCADPEAVKEEYVSGFGLAAPAVREYLDYWKRYCKENAVRFSEIWRKSPQNWYRHGWIYANWAYKVFPEKDLEKGRALLDKAAELAGNDKDAAAKVAFLRSGLEHAIRASHASFIAAQRRISYDKKMEELKKLHEFRKTLPPFAHDPVKNWGVEKCWKINGKTLENAENPPIKPQGIKLKKKRVPQKLNDSMV